VQEPPTQTPPTADHSTTWSPVPASRSVQRRRVQETMPLGLGLGLGLGWSSWNNSPGPSAEHPRARISTDPARPPPRHRSPQQRPAGARSPHRPAPRAHQQDDKTSGTPQSDCGRGHTSPEVSWHYPQSVASCRQGRRSHTTSSDEGHTHSTTLARRASTVFCSTTSPPSSAASPDSLSGDGLTLGAGCVHVHSVPPYYRATATTDTPESGQDA